MPEFTRRRLPALAGAVLTASLALPAVAGAHISLHPNVIPAGAYATLDVRMPGEQEGAYVTKLDMLLPPGFTSVDYQPLPGWTVTEVDKKLAKPIKSDDGPISDEVSQVIWKWTGPLGKIDNGQFVQFPLSVAIPANDAGKTLKFKAVQSYSNGQVVRWIEPSLSDANPAPSINISRAGGDLQDLAGAEAGPEPGQTGPATVAGAATVTSSGASKGLAVAALIVGALGLIVGLGALLLVGRSRRPRA
jgi:uncharacterized protein